VRSTDDPHLIVFAGQPMPAGWIGKLWELEPGLNLVETSWVLLLDADTAEILYEPHHRIINFSHCLIPIQPRIDPPKICFAFDPFWSWFSLLLAVGAALSL
jgi:hypothetical protein